MNKEYIHSEFIKLCVNTERVNYTNQQKEAAISKLKQELNGRFITYADIVQALPNMLMFGQLANIMLDQGVQKPDVTRNGKYSDVENAALQYISELMFQYRLQHTSVTFLYQMFPDRSLINMERTLNEYFKERVQKMSANTPSTFMQPTILEDIPDEITNSFELPSDQTSGQDDLPVDLVTLFGNYFHPE